jgi:hydrogenase expression/formation protein HypC
MCLAIPGKVLEIDPVTQPKMGNVSFGGIQKRVCIEWVPEVAVGDYVLVHVGFALSKIDEQEALETLKLLSEMGDLAEELSGDGDPSETKTPEAPPDAKAAKKSPRSR